jgi:hypothetical protein
MLHFVGLAMGLSTGLANMVMMGLIKKAPPAEKGVLGRFPPLMGRVGSIGLALLWVTGLGMLFLKWGGFAGIGDMPWQFHVKLTLVIVLSGLIGYLQMLDRRARKGDMSVMGTLEMVAKLAFVIALAIVVFAVLAFT